ncbi:MAG: hypothetical protein ACUBOA_10570 [Candidatus Loosdrechtia sp.]|uniref:hypothetical protein n=1 Tax=Candidatus Loosdrechtia sp. TaxID=3101272 RepID=UPI003A62C423|nr:MAG: hypothetical protein QY305_06000 [Candidatus Jettenia sp. AMX2]
MAEKRVNLYDRLPEIYRIKDAEQQPPGQLKSYLSLVEEIFGEIHENIESLYHDLFIETCDGWVIPYIGDLLGTSHLKGDPWTLRADVADTIALRRRKGTLSAIELLTYNLTKWGVYCVELRENLLWNQHLNHQRPDRGGNPPYGLPAGTMPSGIARKPAVRHRVIRGGTVTLRDPAMLSLLNTPFDPFAHAADVKPPAYGSIRYNLPNLAVFLWRLEAYRVAVSKPVSREVHPRDASIDLTKFPDAAARIARFEVHPLGEPVRLFNTHRFDLFNRKRTGVDKLNINRIAPAISQIDETPCPIPLARLNEHTPAGAPEKYVTVETYDETNPIQGLDISDVGLQLHLPDSTFPGQIWPKPKDPQDWSIRGANLCAWEAGLQLPLMNREVAIDPVIGRIAIGVDTDDEGNALKEHLLLTYTYGAVGPAGAHPISRPSAPKEWKGEPVIAKQVKYHEDKDGLVKALDNIHELNNPVVIEINDSMTHEFDPGAVAGTIDEDGGPNVRLNRSLIIRASDSQRPVIRLARPLRFRPANVKGTNDEEQKQFDAVMSNLTVRLEGLYITRGDTFPAGEPLVARAALHSLEVIDCTLDPGGSKKLDGTAEGSRTPIQTSMRLRVPYGFAGADEEEAFNQTPEIFLQRAITGPLFIDTGYLLFITASVIDAGSGVNDDPATASFAISGAGAVPSSLWGPPAQVNEITVFGRMRVESISGRGGIWVHALEALDNQKGCIKFSYFSGRGDRIPQNHGCVKGTEANLRFVSEVFGNPAYGQLAHTADFRILERGPNDDAMGAFGFLLEAHKWRNIQIRYREFMPVGIRPILIPVT